MIRTVEEFYGRQRELQHVMARIGAQTPQSISLVGERRMGKSSLLWHLSQREIYASHLETPERYVFMLMDCQGQQHLNQEGFCRAFGEHLGTAVGDRLEVAEVGDLSGVERVAQAMEGADLRLVCLFDEFETITRNADFGTEFFGFLRSMANAYPVAFVTASRSNLETLCHNREISESPFFNIFSHIRMGPMSEVEVRELITKPSAEAGMPLAAHAEYIQELGGYLPFFVQIACAAVFDCSVEGESGELDRKLVEQRFLEESSSHFHYSWGAFGDEERQVISQLAVGNELGSGHDAVLKSLETDGYVKRQGNEARIFSSAYATFVQETDLDESAAAGSEGAAVRQPADVRRRLSGRPIYVGLAFILVLLASLIYFTDWPAREDEFSMSPPEDSYSATKAESSALLEIQVQYRKMAGNVPEEGKMHVSSLSSSSEMVFGASDSYRIALRANSRCYLYAYRVDSNGGVSELPVVSSFLTLDAGDTHGIPMGTEWMQPDERGGREQVYFLGTKERDRELEEIYQRLRQTSEDKKEYFRRRLIERLHQQQKRDEVYYGVFAARRASI